jgi:DNA polymerase-1
MFPCRNRRRTSGRTHPSFFDAPMKLLIKPKKQRVQPQSIRQLLGDVVACDTETTGLNPWKGARPFAFSFCNPAGQTLYYEFPVDPFSREIVYDQNKPAWDMIAQFMYSMGATKIFWNAKFDVRMMEHAGIEVRGKIHEGMFAAHACRSDEMTFGLKALAKKYVGIDDDDQKALKDQVNKLRRLAKKAGWNISATGDEDYWLPTQAWRCALVAPAEGKKIADLCKQYAVRDAERTMLLWMMYEKQMEKLKVRKVYDREMELWPVTYAMETRGVGVCLQEVEALEDAYSEDLAKQMKKIDKVQKGVNIKSPQQLQKLLYDKLKLKLSPHGFRKKKTERCTDVDALMELAGRHPLPDVILRAKADVKALSFCDIFRQHAVKSRYGHTIHANFNQCGPKTGRFSCREPNMQQVPSKSAGRAPHPIDGRAPFGPRRDHTWFNIDYSQLEVRIYADLSGEETLLNVIKSGQHVHSAITDHVWGGENDTCIQTGISALFGTEGTAEDRDDWKKLRKQIWKGSREKTTAAWLRSYDWSIVKAEASLGRKNTVNKTKLMIFNQIYGGGVPSLMQLMKADRQEVMEFVKYFDKRIPGMRPWNAEVTSKAREKGFIRTAYGRRIPVDPERAYAAVNYRVQGSAADLMKRALLETNKYLRENNVRAWIVMTIHDEIVFEFHKDEERIKHVLALKSIMEDHGGAFSIPMTAEVERVRKRWSEKEKVKWAV